MVRRFLGYANEITRNVHTGRRFADNRAGKKAGLGRRSTTLSRRKKVPKEGNEDLLEGESDKRADFGYEISEGWRKWRKTGEEERDGW